MGNRAEKDEIVEGAAASQPEPARGPDVVELKPTEAVMEDPEPREDANAVTRPHLRSYARRNRIGRAGIAATMPGRVAAQHRPSTL